MVEGGRLKRLGSVTHNAVFCGINMIIVNAYGQNSVVATGAATRNLAMIVAAVRFYKQKTGGRVAIIAFFSRLHMLVGFANGQYTVVALAANSKDFKVIDRVDDSESNRSRCMTGCAGVTCRCVILRFTWNAANLSIVAIHAI